MADYSIVIPVYNEENVIGGVLDELGKPPGCREIIVVDDGSTDRTAERVRCRKATLLSHPRNRGYGAALKTGVRSVSTEYVVFFDADGQHRLKDLLCLTEVMESSDLVIGARNRDPFEDGWRRLGRKILGAFVNWLVREKVPDFNSGLRAFRTEAFRSCLHLFPDGFSLSTTSTVALYKMGYRVRAVPIEVNPRSGRRSSVRIFRDSLNVLMLIVNLTVLFEPLRFFLPPALFSMAASVIYFALYCLWVRVHVTASMVLLFITGLLIFFLGVVCEQISSVRRELNRR
ncbi:MAG: glycosyltransferase family 2 protein [Candidatus Omnitrophica bacterium]|nr:glycosyltransferase family 2 protein [Candidatus Omnitrophota bacterium]